MSLDPPTSPVSLPKAGFVLCGTTPAGWRPLVQRLQAALTAAGQDSVVVVDSAQAARLQEAGSDLRFIALVEGPAHALAAALGQPPAAVMDTWSGSARELLRLARMRPTRWCLVAADEVRAAPDALADHLAGWGLDLRLSNLRDAAADPLALHLAEAVVTRHAAVRRLHEELHASCVPLIDESPPPLPDAEGLWAGYAATRTREAEEAALVLAQLRVTQQALESQSLSREAEQAAARCAQEDAKTALSAAQASAQTHAQEAERLRAELERQSRALTATKTQVGGLTEERDRLRMEFAVQLDRAQQAHTDIEQAFARAAAERDALLVQLQETQQSLEQECLSAAAVRAQAQAELEATRRAAAEANNQIRQELSAQLDRAQQVQAGVEQARAQAQEEGTLARRAADEANRDRHDLLVQLHHVQEALEDALLRQGELAEALEAQRREVGPPERLHMLSVLHVHDDGPHRHIDLRLGDIRLGERRLSTLQLRLVEHAGHPGLLFWQEDGNPALHAWRRDGEEAGQGFMLLLPGTPPGRETLLRLGHLDWQLVQGLARLLQRHLAAQADPVEQRWAVTASRLLREIEALPVRLRYDALQLRRTGDAALEVIFEGACQGDRDLGDLTLRWLPQERRLQWVAPAQVEHLPLASWPTLPDGRLLPLVDLPVGGGAEGAARRERWAHAPVVDQVLTLNVLDALPGVATVSLPAGLSEALTPAHLADQAAALHKQARRTLSSLRARALARRLVRRSATP